MSATFDFEAALRTAERMLSPGELDPLDNALWCLRENAKDLAIAFLAVVAKHDEAVKDLAVARANLAALRRYRFAVEGIDTDDLGNPIDRSSKET